MVYIVMGVSSAGKTVVGQKLARRLEIPFYDGDKFHPQENIVKMESGRPLSDRDRRPWLEALARKIAGWHASGGAVLACSALKKKYRDTLTSRQAAQFIYLKGPISLIAERMADRTGHFMPEKLLKSQFETLEEPSDAITVSIEPPPEEIVSDILARLQPKKED
ncbi:gluconate kinase, SKI family [Fodinibius roseus]|uniref:Gluconokinase n=1 Tax=Fodinibius roseus TaxID=1194090 RepID=A0A1M5FLX8_9BACT|nr:gluconokinase [Fodinibius roseus]SHF92508.1 gluconate kinase, SKI family [Fodinibius roseus]